MSTFYLAVAGALLANVIAGFWRLLRGPEPEDRLVAAQLLGTTAVGILLLLAEALAAPPLRYVGLIFASLAAVTVVAYTRLDLEDGHTDMDDDAA